MAVTYSKYSPYASTNIINDKLDIANFSTIPKDVDDVQITINETYKFRPDLLAFDLYKNAGLWWVFYMRNPNSLQFPPFDFRVGKKIYVPKESTIKDLIG